MFNHTFENIPNVICNSTFRHVSSIFTALIIISSLNFLPIILGNSIMVININFIPFFVDYLLYKSLESYQYNIHI